MQILPVLIGALAHVPLLIVYFQQLWDRPHYQFFPLVLAVSGYFMWQRSKPRRPVSQTTRLLSGLLAGVCAGLLTLAFLRLSPMIAYVSFVLFIGSQLLKRGVPALGPWLLLWLLVRIPYGQDVALIQWMQRLTTRLSSTALDTIGVEHIADGNVLLFPTTSLFVEEACSGVVSMLAIVACAGILAVWWRRAIVHSLLLAAAGIFLAGAMNVVRVVTIAVALDGFDVNLTEGWWHEALGLGVFAVSLMALFSIDRLLLFLTAPIPLNPLAGYWDYAEGNVFVRGWNRYVGSIDSEDDDFTWSDGFATDTSGAEPRPQPAGLVWDWGVAVVMLLVGVGQVLAGVGPFSIAPEPSAAAMTLREDSIPPAFGGWRRIGFEELERDSSSAFGEHSRIWAFRNGDMTVRVSLDFVFPEWHMLSACYEGVGWTIESTSRETPEDRRRFVESRFNKPNGEHALLMFDLFDDDGQPYTAPEGSFVHPTLRRIFSGQSSRWTLPNYYQVQALCVTPVDPPTPDEIEAMRALFGWFRGTMIEHLADAVSIGSRGESVSEPGAEARLPTTTR